jgi:hypothetical protein
MKKPIPSDQRRALVLLAGNPDGMTEGLLAAHGISIEVLVELVRKGLATAQVERLGRPRIKRRVLKITDAGRETIG